MTKKNLMRYPARRIEKKWQKKWQEKKTYEVEIDDRPKYYVLDMFPYPSGAGLHVGHPLGYIASDIISRHKRMQGYNVLHPMGYDSFGLPAEQYAIQRGIHPAKATEENINKFRSQLQNIGLSYDWSRELRTSDPEYYQWTQRIFLLLFGQYYDITTNKAEPIENLIQFFETNGSRECPAFGSEIEPFSAQDWREMSEKNQSDLLMNFRLAYRKTSYVNWCEELGTVLANDEVVNGVSERGGFPVVQKPMLQWSLRITAYAERLVSDLKKLDWSDALVAQQKNWIGRSEGATIHFRLDSLEDAIAVFTTRPDTLFGCSFMVLAPEHDLVDALTTEEQQSEVDSYKKYVAGRSELERMTDKKVSGAFTGGFAKHPFTNDLLPIYISEYVLKDYGTGAIMAVPAHDERDRAFAEHFDLEVPKVVDQSHLSNVDPQDKQGIMVNSDFLNGLEVTDAIEKAIEQLKSLRTGRRTVNYKLRDANFSRQRYWGEPFPIIYDEDGIPRPVPDEELPVRLPHLDHIEQKDGKSPLSAAEDWIQVDGKGRREVDTMPGFAGSSWYFLRYMDPHNEQEMFSSEAVEYWKDVDCYIGGTEHAVGHLMYARFWHKFLYDLGRVPTQEPFKKLINQGMIQGRSLLLDVQKEGKRRSLHIPIHLADEKDRLSKEKFLQLQKEDNRFEGINITSDIDWKTDESGSPFVPLRAEIEKMSKSKYNVVNPDEVIEEFGTDAFRMFEMFLGPIEDHKPWDTQSITGVVKFLQRIYDLYFDEDHNWIVTDEETTAKELKSLHTCIKKVTEDIERRSFNTCISAMMICVNELRDMECRKVKILTPLSRLLSPFAPHLAEEIWNHIQPETSVTLQAYPTHDESYLIEDQIEYPVCINGKKRGTHTFDKEASKQDIEVTVRELDLVKKWTDGKNIVKVIVVPDRMVNLVVK